MLILNGSQALSQAAKSKLISKFKSEGISVADFSTKFVHIVDLSEDLTKEELSSFKAFLLTDLKKMKHLSKAKAFL